jgi:chitodextrinase
MLDTGSERLVLIGVDESQLLPGTQVLLAGQRDGTSLEVSNSPDTVARPTETLNSTGAQSLAPSSPRVAVLLLNFQQPSSGPPAVPWTKAAVNDLYFSGDRSVAAYYDELSAGQMSLSGDVFGYFTLATSAYHCEYNDWGTAARKAAARAGIDLTRYTNVVYAFPRQESCWWSGMATVPGRNSWVNGELTTYVASHELGHNFGLDHAAALICKKNGVRVAFSSSCSLDEYGDPFDVMGFTGQRHFHNWHRMHLGLVAADEVQTVTARGKYRITPAEKVGSGRRVLRIPKSGGDYYYLEYRQPYGQFDDFSATSAATNGVTIRIAPNLAAVRSKLIDTMPETSSFSDAPLRVGRTFADPINKIYVTVLAVDSTGADVSIQIGRYTAPPPPPPPPGGGDTTPPSAPADLTGSVNGPRVGTLRWSAATDNVAVDGYRVFRNGLAYATTPELELIDVRIEEGVTYQFSVFAVDGAGNVSEAATLDFAVPDISPPGQLFGLSATMTSESSARLRWLAARDNVALRGYQVRRGGELVTTLPPGTRVFTDTGLPTNATYIYTVAAVDTSGNVGPAGIARVRLHPVDLTPPTVPTNLAGEPLGRRKVRLTWGASVDDEGGTVKYRVFRGSTRIATVTGTSYVDRAPRQATFRYRVRAVDASGNVSPFTPWVSVFAARRLQ